MYHSSIQKNEPRPSEQCRVILPNMTFECFYWNKDKVLIYEIVSIKKY